MACVRKTNLANKANYGAQRALSKIKYLVIHYTANDGDTDEANAKYFKTAGRNASAHYFVDDDSITTSVPENYVAWHCGGKRYSNYKTTGGAKFYGKCTNTNSIGVEICDCQKNGIYNFTDATLNNVVELCSELVAKHNIPRDRCIRHFDVSGKKCPAPFVDDIAAWNKLLDRIYGTSAGVVTALSIGDKVKVLKNTTYTGGTFKVWYDWYEVQKINGDKITIGRSGVTTCHINKCNIQKNS